MPLREELERAGDWLFHRRSYLPLVIVVLVLAGMSDFDYPGYDHRRQDAWEVGCFAVSLIGLAIRALTVGCAPNGTSGRNTTSGQVAEQLNTTGMYSVVRHPLYLGNFLMWLGAVLVPRSAWLVVTVVLAYWLYYERIAFAEEEFLRRKFGGTYVAWATRTPAFLPRLGLWAAPVLPFSARTVLRREYSGFFALAALFAALDAMGNFVAIGRPTLHRFAQAVLLSGLASYLVLLTLKRRTRLLHVDGR